MIFPYKKQLKSTFFPDFPWFRQALRHFRAHVEGGGKASKAAVLVATDVAARGLDIPNISCHSATGGEVWSMVMGYDSFNMFEDFFLRKEEYWFGIGKIFRRILMELHI